MEERTHQGFSFIDIFKNNSQRLPCSFFPLLLSFVHRNPTVLVLFSIVVLRRSFSPSCQEWDNGQSIMPWPAENDHSVAAALSNKMLCYKEGERAVPLSHLHRRPLSSKVHEAHHVIRRQGVRRVGKQKWTMRTQGPGHPRNDWGRTTLSWHLERI